MKHLGLIIFFLGTTSAFTFSQTVTFTEAQTVGRNFYLTFPLSHLILRSGRMRISCIWRLKDEVPTTAPFGRSSKSVYLSLSIASRTSSRSVIAARTRPFGICVGTSFSEWIAICASPRNIASSSSLRNRPFPMTSSRCSAKPQRVRISPSTRC